jgi:putative transposase
VPPISASPLTRRERRSTQAGCGRGTSPANSSCRAAPWVPEVQEAGKCRDSFRFSTGAIRCGRTAVTLPRLGGIRTHESARKLARRLENGTARILSATVSRTAQRWFVSFTVEAERPVPERHPRPGSAIGVDLGARTLLTGFDSDGGVTQIAGPKPLKTALRKLQRASRAHSRKQPGSVNRRKSAARLARRHARVANVRADALHKATTGLAARYETVVIWFPSSKTCSGCGTVKAKLSLSERTFRCGHCGLVADRDVNAARNLLHLAASGAERQNAGEGTVRPRPARHVPVKQEPGSPDGRKTGTAPRQQRAAA